MERALCVVVHLESIALSHDQYGQRQPVKFVVLKARTSSKKLRHGLPLKTKAPGSILMGYTSK